MKTTDAVKLSQLDQSPSWSEQVDAPHDAGRQLCAVASWTNGRCLAAILAIVTLQLAVHTLTVYLNMGPTGMYLTSILAVIAISWLFGLKAGLLGAMLTFAANTIVLATTDAPGVPGPLDSIRLAGLCGLVMTATAIGQTRDHRRQLSKDIEEHRRVQDLLTQAQAELARQVADRTEDLAISNRLLTEEAAQRRRAEAVLWSLAEGTSAFVGGEFFPHLVQNVARAFGARFAVVCEHLDQPVTRVRTLAFWKGDQLSENIEYHVKDTPCELAAKGEPVCFSTGIQQLFPNDQDLIDWGVDSYCAIPLVNSAGRLLGHLAVLDDKPIEEDLCRNPALRIFADRSAAELDRRQAEDRIEQMQVDLARAYRLVSMGEMATALAHEVDQPLGVIANNAQACLRGMRSGLIDRQESESALGEIASEAIRAGEIVRRIRGFVAKRAPRRCSTDLNELTSEAVQIVKAESRRRFTTLEFTQSEPIPLVHVDRIQIQQVLLNLIHNAFDAMDDTQKSERRVVLRTRCENGNALVTVTDTGKGVAPENLKRIFDPYFTTKLDGLGIGLSISKAIIEWHGGSLRAEPNRERGMCFEMSLPVAGDLHALE